MASLKNIKLKIHSYKKTGTVTRAMEAVSAVKMRKGQERALAGRTYAAAALTVLEKLSGTHTVKEYPLMQERESAKTCIIVITSDKGLAGSLNSGVVRHIEHEIIDRKLSKDHIVMIAIGRRGAEYFASRGYEVRLRRENVGDSVEEQDMQPVVEALLEMHEKWEIGTVLVGYQNFLSTFEQEPTVRQIVPITREIIREMVKGIRPAKGKYAPQHAEGEPMPTSYDIEPDPFSVLKELMPKLLRITVFHTLLEAKASEHSARMVAMKNATDKAKEMVKLSTRIYNKLRQAAITREVSEIVGGIEAMK